MEQIKKVCEYVRSHPDAELGLATLAAIAGMSRFHFQRSFKAAVGLTPRQFVEACRMQTLKRELRSTRSVTEAIYEAGFGSGSRVYERVDSRLGMTPAQYRAGGKDISISHVTVPVRFGRMMIGATDRGLCFVQFADTDTQLLEMLRAEYPASTRQPMRKPYPPEFDRWMAALEAHLDGQRPEIDLPLDLQATAFQMTVWQYLESIPYGTVQSYSEVAAGIGRPGAARAVARACAANRVALVIPCHRVIREGGALGGYRWGLDRKRALLEQERNVTLAEKRHSHAL